MKYDILGTFQIFSVQKDRKESIFWIKCPAFMEIFEGSRLRQICTMPPWSLAGVVLLIRLADLVPLVVVI